MSTLDELNALLMAPVSQSKIPSPVPSSSPPLASVGAPISLGLDTNLPSATRAGIPVALASVPPGHPVAHTSTVNPAMLPIRANASLPTATARPVVYPHATTTAPLRPAATFTGHPGPTTHITQQLPKRAVTESQRMTLKFLAQLDVWKAKLPAPEQNEITQLVNDFKSSKLPGNEFKMKIKDIIARTKGTRPTAPAARPPQAGQSFTVTSKPVVGPASSHTVRATGASTMEVKVALAGKRARASPNPSAAKDGPAEKRAKTLPEPDPTPEPEFTIGRLVPEGGDKDLKGMANVITMSGVDLAAQRKAQAASGHFAPPTVSTAPVCRRGKLLNRDHVAKALSTLGHRKNIKVSRECVEYLCLAAEERIRSVVEKLVTIAEQRVRKQEKFAEKYAQLGRDDYTVLRRLAKKCKAESDQVKKEMEQLDEDEAKYLPKPKPKATGGKKAKSKKGKKTADTGKASGSDTNAGSTLPSGVPPALLEAWTAKLKELQALIDGGHKLSPSQTKRYLELRSVLQQRSESGQREGRPPMDAATLSRMMAARQKGNRVTMNDAAFLLRHDTYCRRSATFLHSASYHQLRNLLRKQQKRSMLKEAAEASQKASEKAVAKEARKAATKQPKQEKT